MKIAFINHEAALALYKDGASDGRIADETGVSKSTVARWRKRNKLPSVGGTGGYHCHKNVAQKKDTGNPCCGCVYYSRNSGLAARFCEYILIVGHRRPCKGGAGCTVRKEGRKFACKSEGAGWRTFADVSQ